MDKLRAIKYFIKVADTGSFTSAAKSLGVPTSSVSRRIQDLENELDTILFHRSTRLVKLTELGALYLEQISPAVNAVDDANDVISKHAQTPSGILRVTASPGFGRFKLIPALQKLKALYPDIIIDIELTDKLVNLSQNEVDIAIRSTANPPERSVARKLSNNNFILVASPDYLNKHGTPKTLHELNTHKTLLFRGPNDVLSWQAKTEEGWSELNLPMAFISNDGEALVEEALAGTGIGLIPAWGIKEHLTNKRLIKINLKDATVSIDRSENSGIYLLYHRPKYSIQKIKTSVDFLMTELSELPFKTT